MRIGTELSIGFCPDVFSVLLGCWIVLTTEEFVGGSWDISIAVSFTTPVSGEELDGLSVCSGLFNSDFISEGFEHGGDELGNVGIVVVDDVVVTTVDIFKLDKSFAEVLDSDNNKDCK